MDTRPELDACAQPEVVDRDCQPLMKLARASGPAPMTAQVQLSNQRGAVDRLRLADVEAGVKPSHTVTVESSSVTVAQSEPEDLPTSHDTYSEMDDWLDHMEDASPVRRPAAEVRHRVERRADDTEVAPPRGP